MPSKTRARRVRLLAVAGGVIAAGLMTHLLGRGALADLAGDALYAVMVYLLLAFVRPRASALLLGTCALALCTMIELFQLTGLPAAWAAEFWPVRLVLGAGFDPLDLVAYAVGASIATIGDLILRRRRDRDPQG
ncbi:DUF2809 domain-containing protein [Microbacterium sp. NPDC089696]|jgi:hypothetical protein|uniref:ribosomal maturation YjgA family protein n=1 Tax=Microbacterium sp. NPDC089696 TaxID=3364199 RepID=UPI003817C554